MIIHQKRMFSSLVHTLVVAACQEVLLWDQFKSAPLKNASSLTRTRSCSQIRGTLQSGDWNQLILCRRDGTWPTSHTELKMRYAALDFSHRWIREILRWRETLRRIFDHSTYIRLINTLNGISRDSDCKLLAQQLTLALLDSSLSNHIQTNTTVKYKIITYQTCIHVYVLIFLTVQDLSKDEVIASAYADVSLAPNVSSNVVTLKSFLNKW